MTLTAPRPTSILLALLLIQALLLSHLAYSYWALAGEVNERLNPDPRRFVAPSDPAVATAVGAATYGRIPSNDEELRLCLRMLFDWVSVNVRASRDSPYPELPQPLPGRPSFKSEVWQRPSETLTLRSGDCEDAAVLLLSMVRNLSPNLKALCLIVEGSKGGHAAVLVSKGGRVAILDPGLYYFTKDESGLVAFKSLVGELDRWIKVVGERVGEGAQVKLAFSDELLARFRSTNEFIAFYYLVFNGPK